MVAVKERVHRRRGPPLGLKDEKEVDEENEENEKVKGKASVAREITLPTSMKKLPMMMMT